MYERITDRARKVMQQAELEARRLNHGYIGTEHFLLGLLEASSGTAVYVLQNLGINPRQIRARIEQLVPPGSDPLAKTKLPQTPRATKVIELAIEETATFNHKQLGTDDLLVGLIREQEGVAARVLRDLGVKLEDVREEVLATAGQELESAERIGATQGTATEESGEAAFASSVLKQRRRSMYERFTDRARKVMQLANQEAQRLNHEYIGTEHILLGLVKEGAGVAANALKNMGVDLRKIRMEIEKVVQSGPDRVTMGQMPLTPKARKVLEYAIKEARELNHSYVGTEHLLLGLLAEEEGVACQVLQNLGLKLEHVRVEVLNLLGYNPRSAQETSEGPESGKKSQTPALDRFGLDLTQVARKGELGPIVGRRRELERIRVVLECRGRNSPLLIGPPGVGKATLVKGLARILADEPGSELRLVAVSVDRLMANAKDAAAFENAVLAILKDVRQIKAIVLYFDDLWRLLHQGAGWAGARAARAVRVALAEGALRCIATITPELYTADFARDSGLGRALRPLWIKPPSPPEAIEMLQSLRRFYEAHHHVVITDGALEAAVRLSEQYLPEACLPGKAVQILDEAGARVRLRQVSLRPAELTEMENQIDELNRAKEDAVAAHDFEKAAHLRDQADKLKKHHQAVLRDWQLRCEEEIAGPVDPAVIEEVVRNMAMDAPDREGEPDTRPQGEE